MRITLLAVLALAGLAGCAREGGIMRVDDQRQPVNRWAIATMDDESVANAIIAQHTLYPYHFLSNSADLNELGERDVKILARHYSRYPGEINLRRGSENDAMYDARIQSVTRLLTVLGVAQGGIKIVDRAPGGDGVASERAVEILARSMAASGSDSGGGSGDRTDQNNQNTNNRGTQR